MNTLITQSPYPVMQSVIDEQSLDEKLKTLNHQHEALYLGMALDNLPVLLNLHDPVPGAILAIGDAGCGKTDFLRTITYAAVKMHPQSDLQIAVLTDHSSEWIGFSKSIDIFSFDQKEWVAAILRIMHIWAEKADQHDQHVLLLIDDLAFMKDLDFDSKEHLRWLLSRGPINKVWPIVTINARIDCTGSLNHFFRTRIYGRMQSSQSIRQWEAPKTQRVYGNDLSVADIPIGYSHLSDREFFLIEGYEAVKFHVSGF